MMIYLELMSAESLFLVKWVNIRLVFSFDWVITWVIRMAWLRSLFNFGAVVTLLYVKENTIENHKMENMASEPERGLILNIGIKTILTHYSHTHLLARATSRNIYVLINKLYQRNLQDYK
jgi:hypothetical protein